MLDIHPLSVTPFANIFSHTVGCFLVLSIVAFFVKKLLNLIRSNFFFFYFLQLEFRSKAIITIWKRGFCLCFPQILQYLVPTLQTDSLPSESPGKTCSNVLISSFACSYSVLHCFVVQLPSGVWLCYPMDCRTPGFPILNYLPKFAQIHVHCIGDDIQPSYTLIPSPPFALNLSEHQDLFQWVCIRWPKYWSFSFIISPSKEYSRLIYLDWLVWSPCCPRDFQESSPAPQIEGLNSLVFFLLYSQLSHLYMITRKMYSQGYGLPSSPYEETVFSPLCSLASFVRDYLTYKCVDLFLGWTFCSIDLYICFYASTILWW